MRVPKPDSRGSRGFCLWPAVSKQNQAGFVYGQPVRKQNQAGFVYGQSVRKPKMFTGICLKTICFIRFGRIRESLPRIFANLDLNPGVLDNNNN